MSYRLIVSRFKKTRATAKLNCLTWIPKLPQENSDIQIKFGMIGVELQGLLPRRIKLPSECTGVGQLIVTRG